MTPLVCALNDKDGGIPRFRGLSGIFPEFLPNSQPYPGPSNPCFYRFPCLFCFPIFLAFLVRVPFVSKDFRDSPKRKTLAFWGVSLAFFFPQKKKQGLEGQGAWGMALKPPFVTPPSAASRYSRKDLHVSSWFGEHACLRHQHWRARWHLNFSICPWRRQMDRLGGAEPLAWGTCVSVCPRHFYFSHRPSHLIQGVTNVHLSNVHFVLRDISALLDTSWGSWLPTLIHLVWKH